LLNIDIPSQKQQSGLSCKEGLMSQVITIFGFIVFSVLSAAIGGIIGTITGIWLASTNGNKKWAIRIKTGGR